PGTVAEQYTEELSPRGLDRCDRHCEEGDPWGKSQASHRTAPFTWSAIQRMHIATGAQTGRRGGAGPAGAGWAVRPPPAASPPLTDGRTIRPRLLSWDLRTGRPVGQVSGTFPVSPARPCGHAPPCGPAFFLVLVRPACADYPLWHPY